MSILTRMTGPGINLSVLEAAKAAVGAESEPDEEGESSMRAVPAMVSLGEGGFFTGLWELSKMTGCGLEADLQAVPILQETIEITDYFGINPYVMRSAGSLLIAARNGEKTLQYLRKEGFMAARIGKLRAGRDKIIHNGEDVRYLDRPQTDSLTGWYRNKERDFEHSLEQ
jgi:hydrogenase maturation factor